MVTFDSAYYNGELWCAYDLKDNNGQYDEELRLKMRKESQLNKFTCPDCKEHLILCAGPIMEPFFKHHENSKCVMRSVEGGIRYNLGKRLLYQLAKRSFPEAKISNNVKMSDKYRSGILIDTGTNKLSIEYLCYDLKLVQWEEKHQWFQDNNLIDVWILSNKKYKEEYLQTFEYLISEKASPIIKILNQDNEKIILKQYVFIEEANEKLLASLEYNLSELTLKDNGEFDCDFTTICTRDADTLNERYHRERLEMKEQERLQQEEQDRIELEEREKWQLLAKERREHAASYNKINNSKSLIYQSEIIKVIREKLNDKTEMNSRKMKMNGILEAWQLPELIGYESHVRRASNIRYSYLREIDKELYHLHGDDRENKIREVVQYLERNDKATNWIYGK